LRLGTRYTLIHDGCNVVLRDGKLGAHRDAYYATLAEALREVFHRQLLDRLAADERHDLAALRDALKATRAEFAEVLALREVRDE
jgi:hypothetical protein